MDMYGERLRLRRKARGLSQTGLAKLVGCTGHHICNLEKHHKEPDTEVGIRIAGVLGEF